jgi:HlyD family secretion protein
VKRPWIAWGLAAAVVAVGVAVGAVSLRGPLVDAVVVQSAPLVRTLQFSARVATLSRVDVGSTRHRPGGAGAGGRRRAGASG